MKIKKKTVSDQTYKIIKIHKPRNSQSNQGSIFWTIDFQGSDDRKKYYTQIDQNMKNFDQWKEIMNLGEQTVIGNLRIKNLKTGLINADSIPEVITQCGNTFHNLFQ